MSQNHMQLVTRKAPCESSQTHGCPIHDHGADPSQSHCNCSPEKLLLIAKKAVKKDHVETLLKFQRYADEAEFKKIFGEHLGEHLWRQFCDCYLSDVLKFYASLKTELREKLVAAVNTYSVRAL